MAQYHVVGEKVKFYSGTNFFEQGLGEWVKFEYVIMCKCREWCEKRHGGQKAFMNNRLFSLAWESSVWGRVKADKRWSLQRFLDLELKKD